MEHTQICGNNIGVLQIGGYKMFDKIKEKYSLSDAEAMLIKKGILFNALSNISKMLPVGICAYVLSQMYSIITNKNHSVISGVHPSPLSAHKGFFGGRFFSRANEYLDEKIDWRISE